METHLGGQRLSSRFAAIMSPCQWLTVFLGLLQKYFRKLMEWSNGSNYDLITSFASVTVTLLRY